MWPTFNTEQPFEPLVVNDGDMRLATMAFGFTIGFGYFVSWHALRQTRSARGWSAYIIMCWLEILVCAAFAIICWLYLCKIIEHSFWFYFWILTIWALQVHFLLQIIVNRICILLPTPSKKFWLKFIIAAWITAINVSVYCVWLPAKLQITKKFHDVNLVWDRIEKVLYLITDGILNYMFIHTIKQRLISLGLRKYDRLVKFNERIIMVSLSMDVLIIAMMSYRNDFVYMQFHPVAYMVKLEIEMCMSKLMIKVATGTGVHVYEISEHTTSQSNSNSRDPTHRATYNHSHSMNIQIATHVTMHVDHEVGDHEAHELEERDHKQRPQDDSDIESSSGLKTFDLVPEDGQEYTRTAEPVLRSKDRGSKSRDRPDIQGQELSRAVGFSPRAISEARPQATGNILRDGADDHYGNTFVSYLGTTNVQVVHSSSRSPLDTP